MFDFIRFKYSPFDLSSYRFESNEDTRFAVLHTVVLVYITIAVVDKANVLNSLRHEKQS